MANAQFHRLQLTSVSLGNSTSHMKKRTFRNTHPFREALEKDGIALMLSGSYVLTTLDEDALEAIRRADRSKLSFSEQQSVVVTNAHSNSKRGKLARIARLSSDGRFARYHHPVFSSRSSIISLRLINAAAFTPEQFITLLRDNETLHVRRQCDGRDWVGVLFGSDADVYSSLVIPADTPLGFDLVDIETELNPHNARGVVTVIGRNPTSGKPARDQILRRCAISRTV